MQRLCSLNEPFQCISNQNKKKNQKKLGESWTQSIQTVFKNVFDLLRQSNDNNYNNFKNLHLRNKEHVKNFSGIWTWLVAWSNPVYINQFYTENLFVWILGENNCSNKRYNALIYFFTGLGFLVYGT